MTSILLAATIAFVVTSVSLPFVYLLLREKQIMDVPNPRSSHDTPVPRGAGVAQLLGVGAAWGTLGWMPRLSILGPIGFGLLGLLDDLKAQRVSTRLLLQLGLGAAIAASMASGFPDGMRSLTVLASATLFVVIIVNTANFMDGINGVSALNSVIIGLTYAYLLYDASSAWSAMGASLAAVSLAFLPWNWGFRARIFLGDSGSYLMGAMCAILALAAWGFGVAPVIAVAPLTVYLTDVMWTITKRISSGQSVFAAHREHTYQKLVSSGLSHSKVALLVGLSTTCCCLVAVISARYQLPESFVLATLCVVAVAYTLSQRFLPSLRQQRRQ